MLFRFDGEMECGTPAPLVQCFTMEFTHTLFEGPKAAVPAMNRVKQVRNVSSLHLYTSKTLPPKNR